MEIYLYRNDQQEGPYTEEELRNRTASDVISQPDIFLALPVSPH